MDLTDVVKCAYDSLEDPLDFRGFKTQLPSLQPKWQIKEVIEICVDKYLAPKYGDNCVSLNTYALLDAVSDVKSCEHPRVWGYIAPHVRQFGFRLWGDNDGKWESCSFLEKGGRIERVGPQHIELLALGTSHGVPMFNIQPGMLLAEALANVVTLFNSYEPEDLEMRRLRRLHCYAE